eukprot:TRINITY_DN3202_c0_g3_i1.p1 TRINITY_DN3202_c0_g3~~TRINITY_DN3202_c0_g3_i1.p1  ORF type:complete len:437 (+),score=98.73 TRINITY_DN3202_c0_g3_i1:224-1534(+)
MAYAAPGALERVIAASRNPNLARVPSPPENLLPDAQSNELIIEHRELKTLCTRFRQQLVRSLMLRDFDQADSTARNANQFLTEYISSLKQAMNTIDMELAERLSTAVVRAEHQVKALRGTRNPGLLERVHVLLKEVSQRCDKLQRCMQKASDEQKFGAAAAAQKEIRRLRTDFRKRLVVAFDRAVKADETGCYSVDLMQRSWDRIQTEVPTSSEARSDEGKAQETKTVLMGLSPRRKGQPKPTGDPVIDRFNRSKRGRKMNKKMDRIEVSDVVNRLSKTKPRGSIKGRHAREDDQENCTFKPDIGGLHKPPPRTNQAVTGEFVTTVKGELPEVGGVNADEANARRRKMMRDVCAGDILPSTGLRGKAFSVDMIEKLIQIPAQVKYWQLEPPEVFRILSAPAEQKLERLYNIVCEKHFLTRLEEDKACKLENQLRGD